MLGRIIWKRLFYSISQGGPVYKEEAGAQTRAETEVLFLKFAEDQLGKSSVSSSIKEGNSGGHPCLP